MAMEGAKRSHKTHKTASLSPTRVSEVTIDAPEVPYKVVLRPEIENLSPIPDRNYFQVTDWIYTQEKASLLRERLPRVTQSIDSKLPHSDESAKIGKIRPPYLVDREVTDPSHRRKLMEAICIEKDAFYYYKERHLFKPRDIQLRSKLKLPTLSKKAKQSQMHSSAHESTLLPDTKPSVQVSPLPHIAPSPRVYRKSSLSQDLPKNAFLHTIIEKCDKVKPAGVELNQTSKERELHRRIEKQLEWTKRTLDEIDDCEVDILIPYYRHQKEALEDFQKDAMKLTEEFHHSAIESGKSSMKLEKTIKKNKGMVL